MPATPLETVTGDGGQRARLRAMAFSPHHDVAALLPEVAAWLGVERVALKRGDVWLGELPDVAVPDDRSGHVDVEGCRLWWFGGRPVGDRLTQAAELVALAVALCNERVQRAEAEARYNALLDAGFEGIVISHDGVVLEVNTALAEMYGYTRAELVGKHVRELVAPDVLPKVRQIIASGYTGTYETTAVHAAGHHVPLEARGKPATWGGLPVRVAAFRDLRREREIEADLLLSEARLREAQAHAHIGSFSYRRGEPPWWSEEMYELFGLSPAHDAPTAERLAQALGGCPDADALADRLRSFDGAHERWELEVTVPGDAPRTLLLIGRSAAGQGLVSGTAQDISLRKHAEAALVLAKEAALENSRLKSRFLANMSHEIRTPMNGVLGLTRLVLDSDLDAGQRHLVSMVQGSAEALLSVVDDILDLAKIEADRIVVEQQPFDLGDVVEVALQSVRSKAWEKGLDLTVTATADVGRLCEGDATRLRQVLINLLDNAIKFTEQGTVELALSRAGDLTELRVTDSGIGLTPDELACVFDPFVQAGRMNSARAGGTGLGLGIAHAMMVAMGGDLVGESEPGVGTSFTARLPMRGAPHPTRGRLSGRRVLVYMGSPQVRGRMRQMLDAAGATAVELESLPPPQRDHGAPLIIGCQKVSELTATTTLRHPTAVLAAPGVCLDWAERGLVARLRQPIFLDDLEPTLFVAPGTPIPQPTPRAFGLNVLVAEDNRVNQLVTKRMAERLQNTVTVVEDGAQAVEAVRQGAYDLILMDLQMPEMDGLEATRAIRALDGPRSHVRIVAVTARAMQEDRQRCIDAGMDDYISKPVRPQALEAVLGRLFGPETG